MLVTADLIGKPFDQMKCWDLVHEIFLRLGINVGNYQDYEYSDTVNEPENWIPIVQPEQYSLCVFSLKGKEIDHVGVYLQEGKMIHATVACGVCMEHFSGYRRFLRGMYRVVRNQ